jgi:hypothetical protein
MCFPTARICDAAWVAGPHRDASPVLGPHRGCGFRWFIENIFISVSHVVKFHHEPHRQQQAPFERYDLYLSEKLLSAVQL